MPRYARETTVPVERSRAEIEETLKRYGASEFHSGWKADAAMIAFRMHSLFIRFVLPIPAKTERRFTNVFDKRSRREKKRSEGQALREWEQEIRARWRGLLLNIKGKLEATELGITTIEEEFLAHIILPNDVSVGEWIIGEALPQIAAGRMPQLGYRPPAGPKSGDVIDVEAEPKSEGGGS